MQTLVLSKLAGKESLWDKISYTQKMFPGEDIKLISPIKISVERVKHFFGNVDEVESVKKIISGESFNRVVLLGFERNETLPVSLLVELLSCGIDAINALYDQHMARYAPFKDQGSTTLLVFPGSMLPLNMGSHQRAFLLLAALNYAGYPTDVIITGGNASAISKSKRLLQAIAPNVYTYKNNKRKLPDALWIRRECERVFRKKITGKSDVPELFADRYANKATESLKKTLASLQEGKSYKNIIVSYAWMSRCLEYIPKEQLENTKLICDTHDVQYMRNASSNASEKRFLTFSSLDAWLEKRVLSKYRYVMAISKSDSAELKKTKSLKGKVLTVSSAFDYALKKPKRIGHKPIWNFGFIGGGMDANVKALEYILSSWWPLMSAYSPESKFYIAGSICNKEAIIEKTFFDESVVKLGFVDNISSFYDRIDVSLNPVLVQGGLNFKSVEAVLAGKLLITNSMGSKCLGDNKIANVADTPAQFLETLKALELLGPNDIVGRLEDRQQKAMQEFGEQSAYQELKQVLSI